jgi:CDGSH-type Zn-finger protein
VTVEDSTHDDRPRISTRRRGPLVVEGCVRLYDASGNELDVGERSRVLLCRCGASRSKPLCDGSHYRIGFEGDADT